MPNTLTPTPTIPIGASLELKDVFKIYKEAEVQTVALRGVTLEVKAGDFVAVVGQSGSGKSTLFGLLAGLLEPSAGTVLLDGQNLSALPEETRSSLRRDRLGVTFQKENLLPFLTALENVCLPLELAGFSAPVSRAKALLAEVALEARLNHFPNQLSGGEQARVALAVALANTPGLILADEPTGELDSHSAAQIMALLERLNFDHGITLLIVTHNPTVAARARRRVSIRDGVLTEVTVSNGVSV